jgi:hypothetical protein
MSALESAARSLLTRLWRPLGLDPQGLRLAGGFMLLAGAILPLIPGYDGIACPLRTLTGVPCPFCGMSTSVQSTLRLRFGDAFEANPAGIVAVVAAVVLLTLGPRNLRLPVIAAVVVIGFMWVFELHRFSII